MTTQLTSQLTLEKTDPLSRWHHEWQAFFTGSADNAFETVFQSFQTLLQQEWVVIENHELTYHHRIKAAWFFPKEYTELEPIAPDSSLTSSGIAVKSRTGEPLALVAAVGLLITLPAIIASSDSTPSPDDSNPIKESLKEIHNRCQTKYEPTCVPSWIKLLDLPTKKELITSFYPELNKAPFKIHFTGGCPDFNNSYSYKKDNQVHYYDCRKGNRTNKNKGFALPLLRLTEENQFNLNNRQVFFRFLALGWLPQQKNFQAEFTEYHAYTQLLALMQCFEIKDFYEISQLKDGASFSLPSSALMDDLLEEDTRRADLEPYNPKRLTDTNLGHWSLWPLPQKAYQNPVSVSLDEPLVARDPQSSIVDGLVGIDFGTKSTVVVYQKETVDIYPMRVGTGRMSKKVSKTDYENPTVMHCINLTAFMEAYQAREGRPFTRWEDLSISHTAASSMMHSPSSDFNTFVSELKQWAGDKNRKLKLVDKQKAIFDLPAFVELTDEDLNPIELYAYYLGLYINHQNNGIFLNYTLSFPVTYENAIREKILQSFKKGLKKSLPLALHYQMDLENDLKVYAGTSEPAAYAAVALKSYKFDPSDNEKIFYGVFDFGGGTTDFDFGIFREANGRKERRYDFVIEHFGAGGDRFLGGENLLEMLAYEVFKANAEYLLEQRIQFTLPPEGKPFAGSEPLLAQTREAKRNTKALMEALRPFWEGEETHGFSEDSITLNLYNKSAQEQTNLTLNVELSDLEDVLKTRMQKGVENFFHGLRKTFSHQSLDLSDIDQVHIFLAGNASKSRYLKPLFEAEIEKQEADIQQQVGEAFQEVFKIYPPLEGEDLDKPNGKTGVAFGLIETRKGGDILIKDHNTSFSDDIRFKFYLGDSRKQKFKVVIPRETPYNEWKEFIDAFEDTFEIFYSCSERVSSNQVPINDASIKKKLFSLDVTDENAFVYIRLVDSTTLEYVVADEEGIKDNNFLSDPVRVNLE